MKICVVGAGAIGGFLAVRLANAGHEVSVVARGAHLQAIRRHGLRLVQDGETMVAGNLKASSDMASLGVHDLVLLAVKSHQIEPVVDELPRLHGEQGLVVTLQNGIPWWYFQKLGGPHEGRVVHAVDADGLLARAIDPDRLLGCIAYPATTIAEPGVIKHVEGIRFPVGELDGSESARALEVAETFNDAGFKSYVLPDIRSEIWLKLWGNLSFNPISALTHSTLVDICRYPASRELATIMMTEAETIGKKLGATFRVPLERRIEGAENVGKHKTSMLQDLEAGRSLEIDGMLGAVIELGQLTGTPTPALSTVHALVSLLNKTMQDEQLQIRGISTDAPLTANKAVGMAAAQ